MPREILGMPIRAKLLEELIIGRSWVRAERVRRIRRSNLSCESLEGRVAPAHGGLAYHALAHLHAATVHAHHHAHASVASSTATQASGSTTGSAASSSSDS